MASLTTPLSEAQREHFRTYGYLHLKKCFTKDAAYAITKDVWTRLGMNPSDQSTWTAERTHMPNLTSFSASEFAPRAWAAICELCGGEDRIVPESGQWRDGLIVNLGTPENEGKDIPPQTLDNWHVDGDFFVHYLDSPEQGLLVIPLLSDITPGGGGTVICPEGIPKVARHLFEHPEGVSPRMTPRGEPGFKVEKDLKFFGGLAQSCNNFIEVTGECGDVFLLHPLMLHSASKNPRRLPRIITNPPVSLKQPFCYHRPDGKYSLVEQTTLRALGRDSLPEWKITAEREFVVPERLKKQAERRDEELKRIERMQKISTTS